MLQAFFVNPCNFLSNKRNIKETRLVGIFKDRRKKGHPKGRKSLDGAKILRKQKFYLFLFSVKIPRSINGNLGIMYLNPGFEGELVLIVTEGTAIRKR